MKTIVFFLIPSILLEATVITVPITLLIIIFAAVTTRNSAVYMLAFISGLFLDILHVSSIGVTSAYFTLIVFIIFLYQKKFEIDNLNFVLAVSFLASFFYLSLEKVNYVFLQSITAALLAGISFFVYKLTTHNGKNRPGIRRVYLNGEN